jgi:hypothetical protein
MISLSFPNFAVLKTVGSTFTIVVHLDIPRITPANLADAIGLWQLIRRMLPLCRSINNDCGSDVLAQTESVIALAIN